MLFIISIVIFYVLVMMINDVYRPIAQKNLNEGKFMPVNADTIKVFFMLLGVNAVTDFIALQHVNLITDILFSIVIMVLFTFMSKKKDS